MSSAFNIFNHLILPGMGVVFLIFGVKKLVSVFAFTKKAHRTTATVINFANTPEKTRNAKEEEVAVTYPIIRYTTQTGQEIVQTEMNAMTYKIGDQMTIYYTPNNPKDFLHVNLSTLGIPVIACLLGLIFVLYPALTF